MLYRRTTGRVDLVGALRSFVHDAWRDFVRELRSFPADFKKVVAEEPDHVLLAPLLLPAVFLRPGVDLLRLLWHVLATRVTGVRSVETEEDVASEDIQKMLLSGKLSPSDLVYFEGDWLPLEQSAPFWETCEQASRRARVWSALGLVAMLLVFGPLLALVLWAIVSIPDFIHWLGKA